MMRLAFFSPFPPSKSGIADYSQALVEQLRRYADVETFEAAPEGFDPGRYEACIYQIGNNLYHEGAWRAALAHPGIVVLHEANLHHLIAEITIKRGDWDAYFEELAYEGGPEALERGKRVRAGETGPDYYGVPMLRRVLEAAKAVIVHSRYVEAKVREAGFTGPVAVIPHGAWLPEADRNEYRRRLGLDEATPLAGIFGFLKPYKRIPECLGAFRRLVRLEPRAKMILTGEPHPELDIPALAASLDLEDSVRLLGFVSEEDLNGFIAACDVVLNLRYPTVGESSGTLLRALGLGRAAIVSEVGAFAELPDEVCLKVPPGPAEEDLIFEYLNLLVARPEVRRTLGRQARRWVETQCSWPIAARQYADFARAVAEGREWKPAKPQPAPAPQPERRAEETAGEEAPAGEAPKKAVLDWRPPEEGARKYVETHIDRLARTLAITPRGGPEDRILEMGAYMQITPALHFELGYGEVRGCYYGEAGKQDFKEVTAKDGRKFTCVIDLFDAERDPFPYPDEHFATVLCCELIEHLQRDPMHMMAEINRILRPGGHLVLTTPNIASLRAIAAVLLGYHPGLFPAYLRPGEGKEEDAGARHAREYTAKEIARLLIEAGFEVERIETGPFRDEPRPEHYWVRHLLERYNLETDLRGDGIYAVGRKTGPVRVRYPDWLYDG